MSDDNTAPSAPFPADDEPIDLSDIQWDDAPVLVVFWGLAFVVFLQFFTRYVLNNSLGWTEEQQQEIKEAFDLFDTDGRPGLKIFNVLKQLFHNCYFSWYFHCAIAEDAGYLKKNNTK